jgi:hypothetical protein
MVAKEEVMRCLVKHLLGGLALAGVSVGPTAAEENVITFACPNSVDPNATVTVDFRSGIAFYSWVGKSAHKATITEDKIVIEYEGPGDHIVIDRILRTMVYVNPNGVVAVETTRRCQVVPN